MPQDGGAALARGRVERGVQVTVGLHLLLQRALAPRGAHRRPRLRPRGARQDAVARVAVQHQLLQQQAAHLPAQEQQGLFSTTPLPAIPLLAAAGRSRPCRAAAQPE